jgi:diguanylate cyclase (GGDEF)-like protein/PAS domain S-box-containing protein
MTTSKPIPSGHGAASGGRASAKARAVPPARGVAESGHRHALLTDLRESLVRQRAQFEAIGRVGQAETLLNGDMNGLARDITAVAVETIGCARANVWLFNEDETELECIDHFDRATGEHSTGMVLREKEFVNEFEALKSSRYVDASDAATDPRTAGYVEGYIRPNRITAMLDTSVHVASGNLGVICFEHVDTPHRWTQDEIAFGGQLADKFAFGLMSSLRLRADQRLRASEASLALAQAIAHVGSWEYDHEAGSLYWSDETYRIFNADPKIFLPSHEAALVLRHPDDREKVERTFRAALEARTAYALRSRVVLGDGRVRVVYEIGQTSYDEAGKPLRTIGTVQDITERKAAEEALAYHDRILRAVTRGTARLIKTDSLAEGMPDALRIVGETIGVERVLVIENPPDDGSRAIVRHVWESADAPASIVEFGIDVDPVDLDRWRAPLAEGLPVVLHLSQAKGSLRTLFERLGNKSVLLMSIPVDGRPGGVVGIDACKEERTWTSVEIDALAIFAGVIGGAIQRRQTRESLERSEERFRAVSETARDAIIMTDADMRVVYWNRAAERILGHTAEEAQGKPIRLWMSPEPFAQAATGGVSHDGPAAADPVANGTVELEATRSDGSLMPVELSISSLDVAGERYAVCILRDITMRKQAEAKMLEMAHFDSLTGLLNRRIFVAAAEQAIARAQRSEGREGFAVLYLDLDHFKDVNDTLGHPVGDKLLQEVGRRLTRAVRKTDTVARFGGDEFAVLAIVSGGPANVAALADKVLAAISKPVLVDGNAIRTGTSVGIAVYGTDATDAETLLSYADLALYRAKSEGRGTYRFFTEAMDVEVRARVRLAIDLREAIETDQLFLMYQPQVDIRNGRIVGLEALVRWRHPTRGLLDPSQFIAVAEQNGLISALGHWVLGETCRQLRRWLDDGIAVARMAVNLSALQFKASELLERDIAAVIAGSRITPDRIEFELTESVFMESSRELDDMLGRLRDQGFRLSIDDFGTGYSSLAYLRRLPVDRIKLAQEFIRDVPMDPGASTIVKAAIAIAREFGLTVIAEGVETEEQLALLKAWGCHEVQGYLYSPPRTPDDLRALLLAGEIRPAPAKASATGTKRGKRRSRAGA